MVAGLVDITAAETSQNYSAEEGNGADSGPDKLDPTTATICGQALDLTPLHVRWQGEPPAREWLLEGWIPAGTVSALYGDGGAGKTLLAMQLGTCVGLPGKFLGIPTTPGRALGFLCEDDDHELWRRQADINKAYGISMEDLGDRVQWISREGEDNLLCHFDGGEQIQFTPFYLDVRATIEAYQPSVVFIDTAADTFGGNDISTPHVRQFVKSALGGLARKYGCAVVLLAHPSAAGQASGEGTHGSRQWNNAVRARLYLEKEKNGDGSEEGTRVLTTKKTNYGPDDKRVRLYWDQGTYWPVLERGSAAREREESARRVFLDLLRMKQRLNLPCSMAKSSTNYAPKLFASEKEARACKLGRKDLEQVMNELLREGAVVNAFDSHRKTYRLEIAGACG